MIHRYYYCILKILLLTLVLTSGATSALAQQKLAGKYVKEHQLFIPNDTSYLVEHFKKSNIARFTRKKNFYINKGITYGEWGLIDTTGTVVISNIYSMLRISADTLAITTLDGKDGLYHINGKTLIEPQYENISWFYNGMAVVKSLGRYGYINSQGKEVVSPTYDLAFDCTVKGLMIVELNKKKGLLDSKGNIVLKPEYDNIQPYDNNFISVLKNKQYALFDLQGNILIDFSNEEVRGLGHPEIISKGKRLYNVRSQTYLTGKYQSINVVGDGSHQVYVVKLDQKKGLIDAGGKIVAPIKYDNISMIYSNDRLAFTYKEKHGFMDVNGNIIVPAVYDKVTFYKDGVSIVRKGNVFGYIDEKGNYLFSSPYGDAYDFSDNLAPVVTNNLIGFIDKKGTLVIQPTYDWAGDFENGAALVKKDGDYFYINRKGNRIE